MANPIRLDNYEDARSLAKAVRNNAEKINDSFKQVIKYEI